MVGLVAGVGDAAPPAKPGCRKAVIAGERPATTLPKVGPQVTVSGQ